MRESGYVAFSFLSIICENNMIKFYVDLNCPLHEVSTHIIFVQYLESSKLTNVVFSNDEESRVYQTYGT